ncbi:hypothetical protein [Anaerotruncus colihominis]|uniref:hypothetical protein n=1 Tax=Anaerotruncus colihominis TaxID=169435 RepID=UPI000B39D085|nr:hypothetical protein [Anaerotruncus colihominis]MCQ4735245.1 hypothetical protein [Anaerotruncus colihominis]OUO68677.1 hypothetical protein B5F55_00175 [Anaerotruncus colihominis]
MSYEQFSLFAPEGFIPETAVSIGFGQEYPIKRPEPWMIALVPEGTYFVDIGGHPMVLRPTKIRPGGVPEGHGYYHFQIGAEIYAGIFVGCG